MKRILVSVIALAVAASVAWAGEPMKMGSGSAHMATMQAEMAKCTVCKHMAAHMDEMGPMKMESVQMNNGLALMHSVEPAKADVFHKAAGEMAEAGGACMTMTDAQAKEQLCSFCQDMRGVMKAGAKMSSGMTKTGDLMVITSDDPAVQTKIAALGQKCAMMSAMMSGDEHSGHAH